MKKLALLLIIVSAFHGQAQVISKFTFDASPLTKAAVGPNGTSVNGTAVSGTAPAPVNYAINPGTPSKDIDLVVPGSPTFDVPGIDIDLYFRREESEASFFKRGSVFNLGMSGGQLSVSFVTNKGSNPGTLTISSGNVFAIPDDHAFHHYRFKYDNNTGVGNIYVDDAVVYTYNGTAGYTMNWSSAGDVVIGSKMDATGRNIPVLGNITIQNPGQAASLPVSLLSFDVSSKNSTVILDWKTTREINVARFVVESSADGARFTALTTVAPEGSESAVHHYRATDAGRGQSAVYYRLKIVDSDGKFTYSDIRKLTREATASVTCFPNPVNEYLILSMSNAAAADFKYLILSMNGGIVAADRVKVASGAQQIRIALPRNIPSGLLTIQLINVQNNRMESFKILKG